MLKQFTAIEPDRKMKITIKDLSTASMELTAEGIELEFRPADGKEHIGDLIITPTKLTWNKGKKSKTGKSINWPEFYKLMKQQP